MLDDAGKIAHFSFTYENVNKTDSFQPSGCNGTIAYLKHMIIFKVFMSVI